MKSLTAFVVFSCLVFVGCATGGRMGELPKIDPEVKPAKAVFIRESNFAGAGISYYLLVDDKEIFSILTGQYTEFALAPGKHKVAARMFGGWTPTFKESAVDVDFNPEDIKFFYVSPTLADGFGLKQIPAEEAQQYIVKYKFVAY